MIEAKFFLPRIFADEILLRNTFKPLDCEAITFALKPFVFLSKLCHFARNKAKFCLPQIAQIFAEGG
jgi:hypothetical protein